MGSFNQDLENVVPHRFAEFDILRPVSTRILMCRSCIGCIFIRIWGADFYCHAVIAVYDFNELQHGALEVVFARQCNGLHVAARVGHGVVRAIGFGDCCFFVVWNNLAFWFSMAVAF